MIRNQTRACKTGSNDAGFSLIELAILLVIVSLLVATALSTFDAYQKRTALNTTIEKRNNIEIALGRFLADNGRLPCPADPALPATHANSGVENCRPGGLAYPNLSPASCIGHCRIEGARKPFPGLNGVPATPGVQKDRLLRGVVPYKTLGLALWEAYDGWGSMMTYTVTELLASSFLVTATTPPPSGRINFNLNYGAIDLARWDKASETDVSAPNPNVNDLSNSWPFVIVSHGPDRRGGWSVNGTIPIPCSGEGRDLVNCDPQSPRFIEPNYTVTVPGPRFYDDAMLTTSYVTSADKWYYSGVGAIRNKEGKVGIDVEDPQFSLHVDGNIRVENMRASTFCTLDGSVCFDPDIIGGSGVNCGPGGMMRGIAFNDALCAAEVNLGSIAPGDCPNGTFLVGFCDDGSRLCRAPAGAEPTCP